MPHLLPSAASYSSVQPPITGNFALTPFSSSSSPGATGLSTAASSASSANVDASAATSTLGPMPETASAPRSGNGSGATYLSASSAPPTYFWYPPQPVSASGTLSRTHPTADQLSTATDSGRSTLSAAHSLQSPSSLSAGHLLAPAPNVHSNPAGGLAAPHRTDLSSFGAFSTNVPIGYAPLSDSPYFGGAARSNLSSFHAAGASPFAPAVSYAGQSGYTTTARSQIGSSVPTPQHTFTALSPNAAARTSYAHHSASGGNLSFSASDATSFSASSALSASDAPFFAASSALSASDAPSFSAPSSSSGSGSLSEHTANSPPDSSGDTSNGAQLRGDARTIGSNQPQPTNPSSSHLNYAPLQPMLGQSAYLMSPYQQSYVSPSGFAQPNLVYSAGVASAQQMPTHNLSAQAFSQHPESHARAMPSQLSHQSVHPAQQGYQSVLPPPYWSQAPPSSSSSAATPYGGHPTFTTTTTTGYYSAAAAAAAATPYYVTVPGGMLAGSQQQRPAQHLQQLPQQQQFPNEVLSMPFHPYRPVQPVQSASETRALKSDAYTKRSKRHSSKQRDPSHSSIGDDVAASSVHVERRGRPRKQALPNFRKYRAPTFRRLPSSKSGVRMRPARESEMIGPSASGATVIPVKSTVEDTEACLILSSLFGGAEAEDPSSDGCSHTEALSQSVHAPLVVLPGVDPLAASLSPDAVPVQRTASLTSSSSASPQSSRSADTSAKKSKKRTHHSKSKLDKQLRREERRERKRQRHEARLKRSGGEPDTVSAAVAGDPVGVSSSATPAAKSAPALPSPAPPTPATSHIRTRGTSLPSSSSDEESSNEGAQLLGDEYPLMCALRKDVIDLELSLPMAAVKRTRLQVWKQFRVRVRRSTSWSGLSEELRWMESQICSRSYDSSWREKRVHWLELCSESDSAESTRQLLDGLRQAINWAHIEELWDQSSKRDRSKRRERELRLQTRERASSSSSRTRSGRATARVDATESSQESVSGSETSDRSRERKRSRQPRAAAVRSARITTSLIEADARAARAHWLVEDTALLWAEGRRRPARRRAGTRSSSSPFASEASEDDHRAPPSSSQPAGSGVNKGSDAQTALTVEEKQPKQPKRTMQRQQRTQRTQNLGECSEDDADLKGRRASRKRVHSRSQSTSRSASASSPSIKLDDFPAACRREGCTPLFFKVLPASSMRRLCLPAPIRHDFPLKGHQHSVEVNLEEFDHPGRKLSFTCRWIIRNQVLGLTEGWPEYVSAHNVNPGDALFMSRNDKTGQILLGVYRGGQRPKRRVVAARNRATKLSVKRSRRSTRSDRLARTASNSSGFAREKEEEDDDDDDEEEQQQDVDMDSFEVGTETDEEDEQGDDDEDDDDDDDDDDDEMGEIRILPVDSSDDDQNSSPPSAEASTDEEEPEEPLIEVVEVDAEIDEAEVESSEGDEEEDHDEHEDGNSENHHHHHHHQQSPKQGQEDGVAAAANDDDEDRECAISVNDSVSTRRPARRCAITNYSFYFPNSAPHLPDRSSRAARTRAGRPPAKGDAGSTDDEPDKIARKQRRGTAHLEASTKNEDAVAGAQQELEEAHGDEEDGGEDTEKEAADLVAPSWLLLPKRMQFMFSKVLNRSDLLRTPSLRLSSRVANRWMHLLLGETPDATQRLKSDPCSRDVEILDHRGLSWSWVFSLSTGSSACSSSLHGVGFSEYVQKFNIRSGDLILCLLDTNTNKIMVVPLSQTPEARPTVKLARLAAPRNGRIPVPLELPAFVSDDRLALLLLQDAIKERQFYLFVYDAHEHTIIAGWYPYARCKRLRPGHSVRLYHEPISGRFLISCTTHAADVVCEPLPSSIAE